MDPNEALRQIRLTTKQMAVEDKTPIQESAELFSFIQHARDLATLVDGLDEWLSRDGMLPFDWMAEEDKPLAVDHDATCTVEHGDWTGPHIRISSCPEPGYDPHGGEKHRFYEEN
jgi:hypothetical protein